MSATMESRVVWRDHLRFDGELEGATLALDADASSGGSGHGPRPKGLVLTALAGCTAMDVVAILAKMKVTPERFEVGVSATLSETHPKVFERIVLDYRFAGPGLPTDKLLRAITLSLDKYCGVAAMLRRVAPIDYTVHVDGVRVAGAEHTDDASAAARASA